jgi:hypothetical protein
MRKVWENEARKEFFEGYRSVDIEYESVLQRIGHGSGEAYKANLWAPRTPETEGEKSDNPDSHSSED